MQSMKSCASRRTSWYLRCCLQLLWRHLDKVVSGAWHCHGFRPVRSPHCLWIHNKKNPRRNLCLCNRSPLLNDRVQRSHCFHAGIFSVIELRHQRTHCRKKCFRPDEIVFDSSGFDPNLYMHVASLPSNSNVTSLWITSVCSVISLPRVQFARKLSSRMAWQVDASFFNRASVLLGIGTLGFLCHCLYFLRFGGMFQLWKIAW